jgi:hypothetical protein
MPVLEHAEPSGDVRRDPSDAHQLRADDSGWGEMLVASLLLTVWIFVAMGLFDGGAAPSVPGELEHQVQERRRARFLRPGS